MCDPYYEDCAAIAEAICDPYYEECPEISPNVDFDMEARREFIPETVSAKSFIALWGASTVMVFGSFYAYTEEI